MRSFSGVGCWLHDTSFRTVPSPHWLLYPWLLKLPLYWCKCLSFQSLAPPNARGLALSQPQTSLADKDVSQGDNGAVRVNGGVGDKRRACGAAGLQVLGQVSESEICCVTSFDFHFAAAIPGGFFTLSSKNFNPALREGPLHFVALSPAAWQSGPRAKRERLEPHFLFTHANAPLSRESCSPSMPRAGRGQPVCALTHRCTQGQASFSLTFLGFPVHSRNAQNSRVGFQ